MRRFRAAVSFLFSILIAAHRLRAGEQEAGARLYDLQRYPEARAYLEGALRENPADPRAAAWLGRVLFEERDLDGAVSWLERAAALDPSSSSTSYWLGRAYGEQAIRGSLLVRARLAPKIRRAFARAAELDPSNLDARYALLEFYLRAPGFMGGSLEKAEEQATEIARRDSLRGHHAAARIHEQRRRWDLARREYEAAISQHPGRPEPFYWLERDAIERKDWETAFDAMFRLENAMPGEAPALYEIGRLSALSGRELERGEASLRRYLVHDPRGEEPSIALAHMRVAEILARRGERERARDEYALALRVDPGLTDARQALARLQ